MSPSTRTVSRREFLKMGGAGLAGAALLGVAGCGGGGGSQEGGSGNIIFSWGPDDTGTLKGLIDEFNQQGDIKVEYREMPSDTGQYFDQLRTEFQAGGGDIDVIGGDVIWPAQFAANGWILDLSDRFPESEQSKFLEGPMQAMQYEDGVYGVPWYTDAGLLYYRRDLLEKSGFSEPPKTWQELKEMASKTMRDSGTEAGFVFQGGQYEGGVVDGLEYIWNAGGDVLDGSKVVIESPESIKGLTTERSMITDGVAPQAVISYKEDESHSAFIRGDSVFLRNWPYVYALLDDESTSDIKPDQVGIAPLPVEEGQTQSYSGLGGWNFFINAASDKQDAAWEFIQFMTDPERQKTNALQGSRLPTRQSLYDDQEVQQNVPVARLGQEAIIQNSRPRPISPYYSDMSLKMADQFSASLKGEVSPEQAVATLQSELSSIAESGS